MALDFIELMSRFERVIVDETKISSELERYEEISKDVTLKLAALHEMRQANENSRSALLVDIERSGLLLKTIEDTAKSRAKETLKLSPSSSPLSVGKKLGRKPKIKDLNTSYVQGAEVSHGDDSASTAEALEEEKVDGRRLGWTDERRANHQATIAARRLQREAEAAAKPVVSEQIAGLETGSISTEPKAKRVKATEGDKKAPEPAPVPEAPIAADPVMEAESTEVVHHPVEETELTEATKPTEADKPVEAAKPTEADKPVATEDADADEMFADAFANVSDDDLLASFGSTSPAKPAM
jgi:hypothetical protein